ncbi:hypothetical protein PAMP_024728 [Pampus punctatissimus]
MTDSLTSIRRHTARNCFVILPSATRQKVLSLALACLDIGSREIECLCKPGYTGARCERCAFGYYGNPMVHGGSCKPCNCKDGLNICDSLTGGEYFSHNSIINAIEKAEMAANQSSVAAEQASKVTQDVKGGSLVNSVEGLKDNSSRLQTEANETQTDLEINTLKDHVNKRKAKGESLKKDISTVSDNLKKIKRDDSDVLIETVKTAASALNYTVSNITERLRNISQELQGITFTNIDDILNDVDEALKSLNTSLPVLRHNLTQVEALSREFPPSPNMTESIGQIKDVIEETGNFINRLGGVVYKVETSQITTTNVNSSNFDRVVFHRVYQDAEVNITQNFTSQKPFSVSPKRYLPNWMTGILDLDPDTVVFYVGGYPEDFTPPVELRYPKYREAMKLSYINDNPVSLMNYKRAVNMNAKQHPVTHNITAPPLSGCVNHLTADAEIVEYKRTIGVSSGCPVSLLGVRAATLHSTLSVDSLFVWNKQPVKQHVSLGFRTTGRYGAILRSSSQIQDLAGRQCRPQQAHRGEYQLSEEDSWLSYTLPQEDLNYRPHFSLDVRTKSSKGLLLHVAGRGVIPLLALYMADGKIKMSLGQNRIIHHKQKSNDGNWHKIEFNVEKNTFHLLVDVTRVTDGPLPTNEGSFLDLRNPVYLGGDPISNITKIHNIPINSIIGCIRDFKINEEAVGKPESSHSTLPCLNGLTEMGTVSVEVNDGNDAVSVSVTPPQSLCDGKFHMVTVSKKHIVINLMVDSMSDKRASPSISNSYSTTLDSLYIGGITKQNQIPVSSPFVGCLRNVKVNGRSDAFETGSRVFDHVSINKCPVD